MKSSLVTPPFQNWSCHGCTDCCRHHMLVELSPAEKRRIEGQVWGRADGVDPDNVLVEEGGRTRLGHQPDGACVFLDATGRCRIHAKFGEAAKPLVCQAYPLALHPAGNRLAVSLRFSCPSAIANRGEPLSRQEPFLRKAADLIVPPGTRDLPAPPVLREARLEWADFHRYQQQLEATLATADAPLALKLLRALHWLGAIERAQFDELTGADADEVLAAMREGSASKLPHLPAEPPAPSRFGRLFFRAIVFQYARRDTVKDIQSAGAHRRRMLLALLRFLLASGRTPVLQPGFHPVPFAELERDFGPLPPEGEEMLTRFFRVKVQGLAFCGVAFHDAPMAQGFRALALLFPVILWLGRWFAAGAGRSRLVPEDIAKAIAVVDHHHGYSAAMASPGYRAPLKLLTQRDDISRLCAWYGRAGSASGSGRP